MPDDGVERRDCFVNCVEFFSADAKIARNFHQFADGDPRRFNSSGTLAEIVTGRSRRRTAGAGRTADRGARAHEGGQRAHGRRCSSRTWSWGWERHRRHSHSVNKNSHLKPGCQLTRVLSAASLAGAAGTAGGRHQHHSTSAACHNIPHFLKKSPRGVETDPGEGGVLEVR